MTTRAHPDHDHDHRHEGGNGHATAVLEVSGVQWATRMNVTEAVLSRRTGARGPRHRGRLDHRLPARRDPADPPRAGRRAGRPGDHHRIGGMVAGQRTPPLAVPRPSRQADLADLAITSRATPAREHTTRNSEHWRLS